MLKKDAVKYALLLIASLLFWGIGMPFATLLISVVITYYYVKRGFRFFAHGSLAVFLSALFLAGFSVLNAIMACIFILPVSFFIGLGFRHRQSLKTVLVSAGLANLSANALFLGIESFKSGRPASEALFLDTYNAMKEAVGQSPRLAKQYLGALELMKDSYLEVLELFMPALLIIMSIFSVYITFGIVRSLLGRSGMLYDNMPYFYQLKLGRPITTGFLFLFALSLIYGPVPVLVNIIFVIVSVLMVCGLSVLDYYLKFYNIPGFVRFILYVVAFCVLPLFGEVGTLPAFLLLLAGILDSYLEFRHPTASL